MKYVFFMIFLCTVSVFSQQKVSNKSSLEDNTRMIYYQKLQKMDSTLLHNCKNVSYKELMKLNKEYQAQREAWTKKYNESRKSISEHYAKNSK